MKIGRIQTSKPITVAISDIRSWLSELGINGLTIDTRYDAASNVALVRFSYKGQNYEFRSTKQNNCRLNMHGIARVMEFKVRASLMGIEDFATSMKGYVQIEDKSGSVSQPIASSISETHYITLGVSSIASNDELATKYKSLMKSYHPDMALSDEAKIAFSKKAAEINEAYQAIKKSRGIN